jgi:hypothetical protein
MLIVFKSAASGDLITFEKNAREMLDVLGKDRDEDKGIVTVDQLPAAIDRIRQAIADDSARHAAVPDDDTCRQRDRGWREFSPAGGAAA